MLASATRPTLSVGHMGVLCNKGLTDLELLCEVLGQRNREKGVNHSATGALLRKGILTFRWLSSRVVSVLESGTEGRRFKLQSQRSSNRLRQTVHTHHVSVHQAVTLVAALLMVAGVTAGLAESNGSLPSGL